MCGRDYDTHHFTSRNKTGFDLLKNRNKIFSFKPATAFREDIIIGIPASLHLFEELSALEKVL